MESRIAQSEVSAKIYSHNLEGDLVGMFRTLSPGDSISVALRKLLQGVRRVKSGYMKICNKGSRHSEYQRSGIKLRDLAFCVWEGASLWAR